MRSVTLSSAYDFEGWRDAARALLADDVPPEQITWNLTGQSGSLFDDEPASALAKTNVAKVRVPQEFVDLAKTVALHRDPGRFALLYRLLWRLRDEPRVLSLTMDPDVVQARAWAKSVGRDVHKMRAFLRFREAQGTTPQAFIAWFEPEHHIVEANAPFFVRRFTNFPWAILTPERSA